MVNNHYTVGHKDSPFILQASLKLCDAFGQLNCFKYGKATQPTRFDELNYFENKVMRVDAGKTNTCSPLLQCKGKGNLACLLLVLLMDV